MKTAEEYLEEEVQELLAENKRLRAALDYLYDMSLNASGEKYSDDWEAALAAASRALEGKE